MKHSNISVFIPHVGCPHTCSFCNQRTISGKQHSPTGTEVKEICRKAFEEVKNPQNTEIAFFGGSFTAVPMDYMIELLESVQEFIGENKFRGIRISTRPDCISREILDILKRYNVTAIELGAQSMSDEVLEANERGHTVQDVVNASGLIKEYGFELGLQMMTGLYKDDSPYHTMREIIKINPDTVRIYPVVVLKGTRLAELYEKGEYKLIPFDEMVRICAELMYNFMKSGIKVIKCGLHASEFVERDMVAGYYHPSFRELCETYNYRTFIESALLDKYIQSDGAKSSDVYEKLSGKNFVIEVNDKCISKATGQKRSNTEYFRKKGIGLKIVGNPDIEIYKCCIKE